RPAAAHLVLADHRDVVLGDAGGDAGGAAGARPQVDRHGPPAVRYIGRLAVHLLRVLRVAVQRDQPLVVRPVRAAVPLLPAVGVAVAVGVRVGVRVLQPEPGEVRLGAGGELPQFLVLAGGGGRDLGEVVVFPELLDGGVADRPE